MRFAGVVVVGFLTGLATSEETTEAFSGILSALTNEIISEHFGSLKCLTYVAELEKFSPPMGTRKTALLIGTMGVGEDELLVQAFELGCGGFVVQVEARARASMVSRLVAAKQKAIGHRYNNQKYLFLPMRIDETADLSMMSRPEVEFLPNLAVVGAAGGNSSGSFAVYGHTALDHYKHNVLGVDYEVLDVWSLGEGFTWGRDLYPDRVRNVMGRKFVFGVLKYSPFSLVMEVGNETVFDGFETRIAGLFVETINGTWEGLDHDDLWGEVFANGSGTGVVGSVLGRRADFGFSGFYQWFCEDVDCTFPFYQSGITCLVPRPNLVSEWLTIILPFTRETWVILVVAYLFNTSFFLFLLLALKRLTGANMVKSIGPSVSDSFFTIFRIQLEQIPKIPRLYSPLAVFIRVMVFYYFFVAAFWQGGIASILTVPRYEKPIDDTTDLVERWPQVQWGANSIAWVNSIRASSDPKLLEIVQKFVVLDDETLKRKTRTKDFGFFMEELPHGHYGFSDYIDEESMAYLRLMRKKIYTAFGVFILPKGSPFSEKFDQWILRMFDTGIVHKMEDQVSLDRINNKLQNMIGSSNEKPSSSVRLAVRHIRGSLYIYVVGMSLSTIVFLIERFFHFYPPVFHHNPAKLRK